MRKLVYLHRRLSFRIQAAECNASTNFYFRKSLRTSAKKPSIQYAIQPSYNHQSNGGEETCTKFVKRTMQKCYKTNADVFMSLLQVKSTLRIPGLTSLAMPHFNQLVRDLLPRLGRLHIMCDKDESNQSTLKTGSLNQTKKQTLM